MVGFIKKVNDTVLFNDDGELIYYIPEQYFDSKVATVEGEYVNLLGIFNYSVFSKSGKSTGIKLFKCPTMFKCKPYKIEKVSKFQLNGDSEEIPYRLLYFKKNDQLICNTKVPKSVGNIERFINLLITGHLPESIPYDEIHEYIINNAAINNLSYNISNQIIGIMVSELCRDKKNPRIPFRLSSEKDMTNYKGVSIKAIPKYISPYTSITSENADESIAAAMNNTSGGDSPLERIMMN